MRRKLGLFLLVGALVLGGAAGCNKKTSGSNGEGSGTGNQVSGNTQTVNPGGENKTLVSQDYPNGAMQKYGRMLLTEKGIYSIATGRYSLDPVQNCLWYMDFATGVRIPLCNKPECRHDGNAFCVATNAKYDIQSGCIYSGRLYAAAVEETDTQYLFKILSYSLDGSEMNEVATFYKLEKTGAFSCMLDNDREGELFIHRNKAVIPMQIIGQESLDDTIMYGTAIVDLETKEVTSLDEQLLSKENMPVSNLQACGDWIYFSRQEGLTGKAKSRRSLETYNLKDGTREKCKLQTGFDGKYAVVDEDTVAYFRAKKSEVYLYRASTGESVRFAELKWLRGENMAEVDGEDVLSDGTYIYVVEEPVSYYLWSDGAENGGITQKSDVVLFIYDREGNEVCVADLTQAIGDVPPGRTFQNMAGEEAETIQIRGSFGFECRGEELYFRISVIADPEKPEELMYASCLFLRAKRADVLAGTPKFELLDNGV